MFESDYSRVSSPVARPAGTRDAQKERIHGVCRSSALVSRATYGVQRPSSISDAAAAASAATAAAAPPEQIHQILASTRQGKPCTCSTIGPVDLASALTCFCAAFDDQPPWTRQPAHTCDSACPLFVHAGCVYICCWSGNYHVCTEDACDRLETARDCMVCSMTAMTYSLAHQATFEQGAGREEYRRSIGCANTSKRKVPGDYNVGTQLRMPASKRKKKNVVSLCVMDDMIRISALVQDALPGLRANEAKIKQLTQTIMDCYTLIRATPLYDDLMYTREQHVILMLSEMAHGGSMMQISPGRMFHFVEPDEDVRREWIPIDQRTDALCAGMLRDWRKLTMNFHRFKYSHVESIQAKE